MIENRYEEAGKIYAYQLYRYITERKGKFFRDEEGILCVDIDGRTIFLNPSRTSKNIDLNRLLLHVCDITALTPGVRIAIMRLRVMAADSIESEGKNQ